MERGTRLSILPLDKTSLSGLLSYIRWCIVLRCKHSLSTTSGEEIKTKLFFAHMDTKCHFFISNYSLLCILIDASLVQTRRCRALCCAVLQSWGKTPFFFCNLLQSVASLWVLAMLGWLLVMLVLYFSLASLLVKEVFVVRGGWSYPMRGWGILTRTSVSTSTSGGNVSRFL